MKTRSPIKCLGLLGSAFLLCTAAVIAEPDKKDSKHDKSEKADKAEKKENKAEMKSDKAEAKEDKTQDRLEQRADKLDEKRMERKDDKLEERRDEKRAERRVYKKGEFKERIQDRDRDRIVTYFSGFSGRDRGLPPQLAKNWEGGRRLPGGWRERVVSGYVIEDDWMPAFHAVPYDWFPEIVVVPDTRLYWYGDRVVRVYEPTREVVDVIVIPSIHIDL